MTDAEVEVRVNKAREQIEEAQFCDYIIFCSDDADACCRILENVTQAIVKSYREFGNPFPDEITQYRVHTVLQEKGLVLSES